MTIPITIAKKIIPRTSSKRAVARIVTPSGESIFFLSDKILAPIPTDVATPTNPKKRGTVDINPLCKFNKYFEKIIPKISPKIKENITSKIPIIEALAEYFKKVFKSVSKPEQNNKTIAAIVE